MCETTGILIWSKLYLFHNSNNKEVVVGLMDTQVEQWTCVRQQESWCGPSSTSSITATKTMWRVALINVKVKIAMIRPYFQVLSQSAYPVFTRNNMTHFSVLWCFLLKHTPQKLSIDWLKLREFFLLYLFHEQTQMRVLNFFFCCQPATNNIFFSHTFYWWHVFALFCAEVSFDNLREYIRNSLRGENIERHADKTKISVSDHCAANPAKKCDSLTYFHKIQSDHCHSMSFLIAVQTWINYVLYYLKEVCSVHLLSKNRNLSTVTPTVPHW